MPTDTIYIPPDVVKKDVKPVHRLARYNYPTRVIGFAYLFILVIAYFELHLPSAAFLVFLLLNCFIWPQVAYLWARFAPDSKRAELANMYADAFFIGLWVGQLGFSLWPTVAAISGVNISHIAYRGMPLMLRGLIPTIIGMAISGFQTGFEFRPHSNLPAAFCSIGVIFFFTGLIAWRSFQQSRHLLSGQRQLEEKNKQISLLATSLEQRVEERTDQLRWKLAELQAIHKVTTGLVSDLTLEQRLQLIVESAVEVISAAEKGSILLYNEESGFLEIKAAVGYDIKTVRMFRLRPGEGFGGRAFQEKKSVILSNIRPHLMSVGHLDQVPEFKSAIVAILAIQDRPIGIISLDNTLREDAFHDDDLKLLNSFAAHAAVAIENARLFTELEDHKASLEKKVDERTRELRHAHAQLIQSEKMASLGQLTAGVAHEINNPITFLYSNLPHLETYIRSFKEILQALESRIDAAERAKIDSLKRSTDFEYIWEDIDRLMNSYRTGAERIKDIVDILRNFARVDEKDLKLADLNQGIESTLTLIQKQYTDRIQIVKDLGVIPEIECLPGQLNQVVMNVVINAMQAIPERGTVTVRTRHKGDWIELSVKDNGVGMSPEVTSRMFEPFYTTKPVGSGTGLGLSISYGIIERHHGKIEVDSAPGKGTTFVIHLPIRQPKNEPLKTAPY